MRKFLSVLLIAGVAVSCFTGCGDSSGSSSESISSDSKNPISNIVDKVKKEEKGIRLMDYDEAVKILEDAGYKKNADTYLTYYLKDGEMSEYIDFDNYSAFAHFSLHNPIDDNETTQYNILKEYFKLDKGLTYDIEYEYNSNLENKDLSTVVTKDTYDVVIDNLINNNNIYAYANLPYNRNPLDVPVTTNKISDVIETDDFYIVCDSRDYGKIEMISQPNKKDEFNNCFNDYFADVSKITAYVEYVEGDPIWRDVDNNVDAGVFNENGALTNGVSEDEEVGKGEVSGVELYDNYDKLCDIVKELDDKDLLLKKTFEFDFTKEYTIYVLVKNTQKCFTMTISERLDGEESRNDSTVVFNADDMNLKQFINEDICSALLSTFKVVDISSFNNESSSEESEDY